MFPEDMFPKLKKYQDYEVTDYEKRIVISLQYIYGIGETTAKNILKATDISEDIRTKNLTEQQLHAIRQEVAKYKVEGDLRREVALNIKRLMEICDILHIYDNTLEPVRIVRKHKDQISIFPNQFWDEERIMRLL